MFTEKNRDNLIKGLEAQLKNGAFYDSDAYIDTDISIDSIFKTPDFTGVGLFRPLVSNQYNPLNTTIYNYKASYATPVHGIAFASKNGEYVEPQHTTSYFTDTNTFETTITNNLGTITYATPAVSSNSNYNTVITDSVANDGILIKDSQLNMADIIPKTTSTNVINFSPIPQNLALTARRHSFKDILFMQIDIVGGIKKIFGK